MNNDVYTSTSPYYFTDIVDNRFLDFMINRPIPLLASDEYMELAAVYEYRPDLLAYDLYSDSKLWWVFAQRNPNTLKDPIFDFKTGVGIFIPKLSTLQQVLGI